MSVYAIVGINVNDNNAYAEYVEKAITSLEGSDVKVLVASDAPITIEGQNQFSRYVLLECKDKESFDAWYNSPAYQQALPIRHRTAETGFFILVDGMG